MATVEVDEREGLEGGRVREELRGLDVVPMRSPQERGDAVGPRRVRVDALVEQRPHGGCVLCLSRGHEPEIRLRGRNVGA